MKLAVTSFNSKIKSEMERIQGIYIFRRIDINSFLGTNFLNWKADAITFSPEPLEEKYSLDSLVYLTSDSNNVLEELDQTKNYIIGGIVDKNRHKNLCIEKAKKLGIAHAQLPISKYIDMTSRKVLTINHGIRIFQTFFTLYTYSR